MTGPDATRGDPRWLGVPFYKLSGSGNDFVFFDAFEGLRARLDSAAAIRALCGRGTGVGADGVVFLEPESSPELAFRMRYYNSDGSRATLCGNAALCATRLSVELGMADGTGFRFASDAGVITARLRGGNPEIDLSPVTDLRVDPPLELRAGERRIGYAVAGVPHLVVQVSRIDEVDIAGRGRELRFAPGLPDGANVNFVAPSDGGWRMRTYERGVEGETLACGTGAVACATVLRAWAAAAGDEVVILTSSGQDLVVRTPATGDSGPSLRGEGRIVFRGELRELP